MTAMPISPEVRAAQPLGGVETALRNVGVSNQAVANSVDSPIAGMNAATDALKTGANSMDAATDALKSVRASNGAVVASVEAAVNALIRVAAAFEEIREDRLRANE